MEKGKKILNTALAVVFFSSIATTAFALPALQLGPGDDSWSYDTSTETWVASDFTSFTVNAYANATKDDGGKGAYAWDDGSTGQYAYLVFSAAPENVTDAFNITVNNNGGALDIYESGYGTPPDSDPNSLAPHGIFPTYYEIYEFQFAGGLGTIYNTIPGDTGEGMGYTEAFEVIMNSYATTLTNIHMDLFTLTSNPGHEVYRFAPFSHDAEAPPIPEPATMLLFGTGLAGLAGWRRKKSK